jgi:hypothetical protein
MKGELSLRTTRRTGISTADAEAIALEVLQRLAAEPERLGRFLALSGLDPRSIRRAAAEPGFLAGVLEHVAGDEALYVELAGELGISPERLEEARRHLSPDPSWEA